MTWDPSPSTNVSGYAIYYGTTSGIYDSRLDVATNLTTVISNLSSGPTYFFTSVSYDSDGDESLPSNEVSFTPPLTNFFELDENTTLQLTVLPVDCGLLSNFPCSFALSNAPSRATINPSTGAFSWTPTEAQGPSTNIFSILATTLDTPALSGSKEITVIVNEVNSPPVLPSQADRTIATGSTVIVNNPAADPDIPANTLMYALINPPTGASIDPNGVIIWVTSSNQPVGFYPFVTVVTDSNPLANFNQHLSVTNSFSVFVQPVDTPSPANSANVMFSTIATFDGTNGASPSAPLLQAADGLFYGTASSGGINGCGTVYRLASQNNLVSLASFNVGNGANPFGNMFQASDGALYGTTAAGGSHSVGVVFRLATSGTLTNLCSFDTHNSLPYIPFSGLVSDPGGTLYGTTFVGGALGSGTIFKITAAGTMTTLASFRGTNGANPYSGLLLAPDGSFLGTTESGGIYTNQFASGCGTIFKLSTNGVLTTIISFNDTNGNDPIGGLVIAPDGTLYGTTRTGGAYKDSSGAGCGTIFKLDVNGTLTSLFSFSKTNGANPTTGLLIGSDGALYGTTEGGGLYGDYGTVFRFDTNGTLTPLISFNGANGAYPEAPLIQAGDGSLYGTTANGGAYDLGTVFRLSFVAAPFLQAPLISANSILLSWTAVSGQKYQIQSCTDLGFGGWTNVADPVIATNSFTSSIQIIGSDPQRYYRVLLTQ